MSTEMSGECMEVITMAVDKHQATKNKRASAKNTKNRVLGVLLGQSDGIKVNVSNSFAVPFEEDEKDSSVWFIDHNYFEIMYDMFRKVNGFVFNCSKGKNGWLVPFGS